MEYTKITLHLLQYAHVTNRAVGRVLFGRYFPSTPLVSGVQIQVPRDTLRPSDRSCLLLAYLPILVFCLMGQEGFPQPLPR